MGSRVELFVQIRIDTPVEGLRIRALARKYKVGRDTVRKALKGADREAQYPVREAPKINRLIDEHGATEVSYSSVRDNESHLGHAA